MSTKDKLEKDLKVLYSRKEQGFRRVQILFDLIKAVKADRTKLPSFRARYKELPKVASEYMEICEQISSIQLTLSPDAPIDSQSVQSFDALYYEIIAFADSEISQPEPKASASSVQAQEHKPSQPRLPKIDLPTFDGSIKKWTSFYDQFKSLIHDNALISPVEKFHYLLSCVSGPAASVVRSLPLSDQNYEVVWDGLVRKYHNKRVLGTNLLDTLLNFITISRETASNLNIFLEEFGESVTALKALKIPNLHDFIILHLGLRSLPSETRKHFELQHLSSDIPSFDQLITFVQNQTKVLEVTGTTTEYRVKATNKQYYFSNDKPSSSKYGTGNRKSITTLTSSSTPKNNSNISTCPVCKLVGHTIYKCPTFNELNPLDRRELIKKLKYCFNCLKNHYLNSCRSNTHCFKCGSRHNTMLHDDTFTKTSSSSNIKLTEISAKQNYPSTSYSNKLSEVSTPSADVSCNMSSHETSGTTSDCLHTVLLGTALVHMKTSYGNYIPVRALIDSGAQASFITATCAQKLGLSVRRSNVPVAGLGVNVIGHTKGIASCSLKPIKENEPLLKTEAIVLPKITSPMPSCKIPDSVYKHFKHLILADPHFDTPAQIQFLIGADLFPFIFDGERALSKHSGLPSALHSVFGWVIMGPYNPHSCSPVTSLLTSVAPLSDNIMKQFWEVEEPPVIGCDNPEETRAEDIFMSQHYRDSDGRYVVPILMKSDFDNYSCSASYSLALSRLVSLERRLARYPHVKEQYQTFLDEYLSLGHMTRVSYKPFNNNNYVIPHHAVFKESSSSTKLRVVFDGSSRPGKYSSLNDSLYIGSKLQKEIVEIILRFRLNSVIFIADICKMYRQIIIKPEERRFQHIIWRKTPDSPIEEYELNTVTYGLASSPFLSLRTMKQLVIDEGHKFPRASKILNKELYIDDVMSGGQSLEEALLIKTELIDILRLAGFELRKWSSNNDEFIQSVPQDLRETPLTFDPDGSEIVKVLGLQFNPRNDYFSYQTSKPNSLCTKRNILSFVARIYDPLGWVCPVIFRLKNLIQHLWRLGLDWDQSTPQFISDEWNIFCDQIQCFSDLKIPRYVLKSNATCLKLVGFCDASQRGYCASVYLYVEAESEPPSAQLLIAKSKVAPLKTLTIPRLELCGALLLSKLLKYVYDIYSSSFQINNIYAFTDSTTVLAWLKTPPHLLKTFVSSRVMTILETIPPSSWSHVDSGSNPADCGSRGLKPKEFLEHSLWFHGPSWLSRPFNDWPVSSSIFSNEDLPELKSLSAVNSFHQISILPEFPGWIPIEKFSSFFKLVRLTAWYLRFCKNCMLSPASRVFKDRPLSKKELDFSLSIIIREVQNLFFSSEMKSIKAGKDVPAPLNRLSPFLDSLGCLRVGGRLVNSSLPEVSKNPFVLPKVHHLTNIIIDSYHIRYLHVGPRALQAILNSQFWIISGRSVIRSRLSKCITCFKANPIVKPPLMGNLPKCRVTPIRPFVNVGVDFGGPFYIKEGKRRNAKISKCYLCLFVCMATKAVHLEVVSELSTSAFLASLDRFVSRRGLCCNIYSDNGTNFVGAKHYLQDVYRFLRNSNSLIEHELSKYPISWRLHPPASPHFNGLVEAGIRSAKYHLRRVVGEQALTFEELSTLFCKIEAVLNSRPLVPLSSDPNDLEVLTPGHFLIGSSLVAVPEVGLLDENLNKLTRWQLLCRISQHFWQRWSREYLHTLQQRNKWFTLQRNLKVGDLVLIVEEGLAPQKWKTARVEAVHPGRDGVVRAASVITAAHRTFDRAAVKLCPLPSH